MMPYDCLFKRRYDSRQPYGDFYSKYATFKHGIFAGVKWVRLNAVINDILNDHLNRINDPAIKRACQNPESNAGMVMVTAGMRTKNRSDETERPA